MFFRGEAIFSHECEGYLFMFSHLDGVGPVDPVRYRLSRLWKKYCFRRVFERGAQAAPIYQTEDIKNIIDAFSALEKGEYGFVYTPKSELENRFWIV